METNALLEGRAPCGCSDDKHRRESHGSVFLQVDKAKKEMALAKPCFLAERAVNVSAGSPACHQGNHGPGPGSRLVQMSAEWLLEMSLSFPFSFPCAAYHSSRTEEKLLKVIHQIPLESGFKAV